MCVCSGFNKLNVSESLVTIKKCTKCHFTNFYNFAKKGGGQNLQLKDSRMLAFSSRHVHWSFSLDLQTFAARGNFRGDAQ